MPYRRKYAKKRTTAKPVYRRKRAVPAKKRRYVKKVNSVPSKSFKAKVMASTGRVNSWNSDVATKVIGSVNGKSVIFQSTATLDQATHYAIQARLNADQIGDAATTKGYYLVNVVNRSEVANISEFRIKLRSYLCRTRRDSDFTGTQLYNLGFSNNSTLVGDELSATPYQSTDFVQTFAIIARKNSVLLPGASKYFTNSQKHQDIAKSNTVINQAQYMKGTMFWLHIMEGALGMDATLVSPTTMIPGVINRQSITAYYRELGDNKSNLFMANQLSAGTNNVRYVNEELAQVDTDGNIKA